MITDPETNFLYLSGKLEQDYNDFYNHLILLLVDLDIKHGILPNTNDIWARDYLPIQVSEDNFVQFKYDPGYLYEKNLKHTITDPKPVLKEISIIPEYDMILNWMAEM